MPTTLLSPEAMFQFASSLAALGWLALAVSPAGTRRALPARRLAGVAIPLLLAATYVFTFARAGMGDGGYASLAAVQRLMAVPGLLLAGWIHYLAFDLFVGTWIAKRAGELGWPHWLVLPLLLLTFLFGPAGLLAFHTLRALQAMRSRRAGQALSA